MVSEYVSIEEGKRLLEDRSPRATRSRLVRHRRREVGRDQADQGPWPSRLKVGLDAINTSSGPLSVRFEEYTSGKPGTTTAK